MFVFIGAKLEAAGWLASANKSLVQVLNVSSVITHYIAIKKVDLAHAAAWLTHCLT